MNYWLQSMIALHDVQSIKHKRQFMQVRVVMTPRDMNDEELNHWCQSIGVWKTKGHGACYNYNDPTGEYDFDIAVRDYERLRNART